MRGTKDTKKGTADVRNNAKSSVKTDAHRTKQKVLLPTLKEQQRYLVYRLLAGKDCKDTLSPRDFAAFHNDILDQCNVFLGVFDGGKAGLMGVKFNPSKMRGIIRVDSKYVDKLKVCLGLIKAVKGNGIIMDGVAVDCISVSGMLNKAVDKMDGL